MAKQNNSTEKDLIKAINENDLNRTEKLLENPGIETFFIKNGNYLHYLLKTSKDENFDNKIAKILIQKGVNIYQFDDKLKSPLYYAVTKKRNEIVKFILDKVIDDNVEDNFTIFVNLNDTYENTTLKDLIEAQDFYDISKLKVPSDATSIKIKGIQTLILNDSCEIRKELESIENLENLNFNNGEYDLFQLLCINGYDNAVKYLLEKGVSAKLKDSNQSPLLLSVFRQKPVIFEILIKWLMDHSKEPPKIDTKVFIELTRYSDEEANIKSLELLLNLVEEKKVKVDINGVIFKNNEPVDNNNALHFTIRYANDQINRKLLNLGGSFALKSIYDVLPVQDITVELLETHLNDCILWDKKGGGNLLEKPKCTVTMRFHSLLYHPPDKEKCDSSFTEISVLNYLSQSNQYKHLLSHPVILTYLLIKWHRIRWIYIWNIIIYFLFLMFLLGYIFFCYTQVSQQYLLTPILTFFLLLAYVLLVIREVLQIGVLGLQYLKNFENFLELGLLISTFLIFLLQDLSLDNKRLLSSASILLGSFVFILLIGQHPNLFTYVHIFRKVCYNFTELMLWYSLLIISFVSSFFLLLREDLGETNITSTEDSFFFTIRAMTGDFGEFEYNSVASKLILSLFILIITIILMNLLSGMAISDINLIKEDAEIMGLQAKIKFLYHTENLIVSNNLLRKFSALLYCEDMIKKIRNKLLINDFISTEEKKYQVDISLNERLVRLNENRDNVSLEEDVVLRIKSIVKLNDSKKNKSCLNCELLSKVIDLKQQECNENKMSI